MIENRLVVVATGVLLVSTLTALAQFPGRDDRSRLGGPSGAGNGPGWSGQAGNPFPGGGGYAQWGSQSGSSSLPSGGRVPGGGGWPGGNGFSGGNGWPGSNSSFGWGGQQGPWGSPGGRSSQAQDPLERWNQRTGGRDTWVRSEITDPSLARTFDSLAQRIGITNGVMTRQQYLDYSQQRSGGPRSNNGAFGGSSSMSTSGSSSSASRGSPDMMAEMMFRRYDQNGDGVLNYDEMPGPVRSERDRWDSNRDGFLDLNEFTAYFQARSQRNLEERTNLFRNWADSGGWNGWTGPVLEEEVPKPVVYRAGNLPKELPDWFQELDTDEDAQIGLYEWRASGRSIDEFLSMDRNGDGFLVPAEVLRALAQTGDRSERGGRDGVGSGRSAMIEMMRQFAQGGGGSGDLRGMMSRGSGNTGDGRDGFGNGGGRTRDSRGDGNGPWGSMFGGPPGRDFRRDGKASGEAKDGDFRTKGKGKGGAGRGEGW